jgi:hypothetical protein
MGDTTIVIRAEIVPAEGPFVLLLGTDTNLPLMGKLDFETMQFSFCAPNN